MFHGPEGVKFGDKPRHSTAGGVFTFRPQRPPEAREEVEAIHGLIEALSRMGSQ
jgi:hypothetical protein